jgi:hypothetical protein
MSKVAHPIPSSNPRGLDCLNDYQYETVNQIFDCRIDEIEAKRENDRRFDESQNADRGRSAARANDRLDRLEKRIEELMIALVRR